MTIQVSNNVFNQMVSNCGLASFINSHAVRMVKFARDSQLRMTRLLDELQKSLGEDTKDLVMRIGLHSGPVTVSLRLFLDLVTQPTVCFY